MVRDESYFPSRTDGLHNLADFPFEELQKRSLKTRPLQQEDFEEAFKQIHSPLTKEKIEEYEKWMKIMVKEVNGDFRNPHPLFFICAN